MNYDAAEPVVIVSGPGRALAHRVSNGSGVVKLMTRCVSLRHKPRTFPVKIITRARIGRRNRP